ncbi:hypothetical protein ACOSP7_012925 [Xanthoceras sorbifolium]
MFSSNNQRRCEDRGAEAFVSGRHEVELPREGALRSVTVAQVVGSQHRDIEVVNGVEISINPPWATYRGLSRRKEAFALVPSKIYMGDLRLIVESFHFPWGHQMLLFVLTVRPVYPSSGYIAISRHHLIVGLRFFIPGFLIDILNLLTLALMQLTPTSYSQLLNLYLSFRRHRVPSSSDNVIRFCFLLKQCHLLRGSPDESPHDGIYYLSVRARDYKDLLQGDPRLNIGDYKAD